MFRGLWVDTSNPIPDDLIQDQWTGAKTIHEAILKLELLEFEQLDLNIDALSHYGSTDLTAENVITWLKDRHDNNQYIPQKIYLHEGSTRQHIIYDLEH